MKYQVWNWKSQILSQLVQSLYQRLQLDIVMLNGQPFNSKLKELFWSSTRSTIFQLELNEWASAYLNHCILYHLMISCWAMKYQLRYAVIFWNCCLEMSCLVFEFKPQVIISTKYSLFLKFRCPELNIKLNPSTDVGTAGVVVSCKIPILATRVRFPGGATDFRVILQCVSSES